MRLNTTNTQANSFCWPSWTEHRGWSLVYAFGLLLATAVLLQLHWQIVVAPVALDYYEGQIPMMTGEFAKGKNPYTYDYLPEYTSVYGIVYHLLMLPFVKLVGNSLEVHRAVNAVLIIISCVLITQVCRREGARSLHSIAAGLMTYAAWLFYSTPIAASNALGLLLMLLSVVIPWSRQFSIASLVVCAVITIIALYTKIYFIAGGLFVGLYLILFVSVQRAAYLGIMLLVLLLVSIYAVVETSPYYFDTNYFAATNPDAIWLNNKTLFKQLGQFALLYAGIFVLLFAGIIISWRFRERDVASPAFKFSITKPLFSVPIPYFWLCFLGALLIICISLGRNPGNWMSYLLQLMTPFFAIASVISISRSASPLALSAPLVLFTLWSSWNFLPKDFDIELAPWNRLETLIQQHESVLSSQALLMPMVRNGKKIYQDGQTFYFPYASGKPEWAKHSDPKKQVEQMWADFNQRHYQRVEAQEYDIALLTNWDVVGVFGHAPPQSPAERGQDYFRRYYERSEFITIDLGAMPGGGEKKIGVWRPRKPIRPAPASTE